MVSNWHKFQVLTTSERYVKENMPNMYTTATIKHTTILLKYNQTLPQSVTDERFVQLLAIVWQAISNRETGRRYF